jgi:hypothetical protein
VMYWAEPFQTHQDNKDYEDALLRCYLPRQVRPLSCLPHTERQEDVAT